MFTAHICTTQAKLVINVHRFFKILIRLNNNSSELAAAAAVTYIRYVGREKVGSFK